MGRGGGADGLGFEETARTLVFATVANLLNLFTPAEGLVDKNLALVGHTESGGGKGPSNCRRIE